MKIRNERLRFKRGTVRVHKDLLFNPPIEILSLFFKNFYPVHIEVKFDVFIYTGMSEHFKEIKEGEQIPEYEAMFKETSEGLNIKFNKL